MLLCRVQRRGAVSKNRNRFDGTSDVSTTADTQTGSISAGAASPAGRHAAHDGQRRHVLRAALSLHLHLQVFPPAPSVSLSHLPILRNTLVEFIVSNSERV